jgi:hypothetical protein
MIREATQKHAPWLRPGLLFCQRTLRVFARSSVIIAAGAKLNGYETVPRVEYAFSGWLEQNYQLPALRRKKPDDHREL